MDVEELATGGVVQPIHHVGTPAFADVHHAGEHGPKVRRHGAVRSGPMGALGAPELIILLVVVLVLFGSTKIPALFRSLGQAQSEFRKGQEEGARKDETPST